MQTPIVQSHGPEVVARRVFAGAAAWGLLSLLPMYALEPVIARYNPPALTHPEFFYGFLGVAVAWQLAFCAVAREPMALRAVMPAAVAEKFLYGLSIFVLALFGRLPGSTLPFALVDIGLGTAFLLVYRQMAQTIEVAQQRFLVLTMRNPDFDPSVVDPHYAFLASLRSRGLLVESGPFGDRSGGAYVIRAGSLEDATALAQQDPLYTSGASQVTVRLWKSTRALES